MRSLERHRDVAAYALGVLDEADAFRFEDHLVECARCATHVTEFGSAARQLMLYRRATPRFVHPMAQPGPQLLNRLLGAVTAGRRATRRRLLYAVAASVVAAVAGPGIVMAAGGGTDDGQVRIAATDQRSGVWAQVTVADEEYGTELELRVKDGAGPRSCRLVVVARDGSEQTVTSWTVPGHDARPNTVRGGSPLRSDDIARYELRTARGEHLVTLEPR